MKFKYKMVLMVLMPLVLIVSCTKDKDSGEEGFTDDDFKGTTLQMSYSNDRYVIDYKIENLKDQPYKAAYGYQLYLWVGDNANPYGSGVVLPVPDIPANGSISKQATIGSPKYTNPKIKYIITLNP